MSKALILWVGRFKYNSAINFYILFIKEPFLLKHRKNLTKSWVITKMTLRSKKTSMGQLILWFISLTLNLLLPINSDDIQHSQKNDKFTPGNSATGRLNHKNVNSCNSYKSHRTSWKRFHCQQRRCINSAIKITIRASNSKKSQFPAVNPRILSLIINSQYRTSLAPNQDYAKKPNLKTLTAVSVDFKKDAQLASALDQGEISKWKP